ncbi:hypothetical protein [Marininema halotolerans]|uniref:Uncharacterized protein n=1 Tax=Marininema halotolerans TaxID=1155944 RepID=A0A1I6R9P5_9BACL|nr:hypothetical protein [Marininema halotolerans]SFS61366.1 hypothetical protein SAMN05444972_104305 [Marininema halotolerans]
MDIKAILQGPGPGTGIFLAASIHVNLSPDGQCATFRLINETPLSTDNPDPLIDQLLFNLADLDSTQNQLRLVAATYTPAGGDPVPASWLFEDSSGPPPDGFDHNSGGCGRFQYLVAFNRQAGGRGDQRLRRGDLLTFTLCLQDPTSTLTDHTFTAAPYARMGQSRIALSFQRLGQDGELSDCLFTLGVVPVTPVEPPPTPPPPPNDFVNDDMIMPLPSVVPPGNPALQPMVILVPFTGTGNNTVYIAEPAPGHQFTSNTSKYYRGSCFLIAMVEE